MGRKVDRRLLYFTVFLSKMRKDCALIVKLIQRKKKI